MHEFLSGRNTDVIALDEKFPLEKKPIAEFVCLSEVTRRSYLLLAQASLASPHSITIVLKRSTSSLLTKG